MNINSQYKTIKLRDCERKTPLKQTNYKYTCQNQTFTECLYIGTKVTFIILKKLSLVQETSYIYINKNIRHLCYMKNKKEQKVLYEEAHTQKLYLEMMQVHTKVLKYIFWKRCMKSVDRRGECDINLQTYFTHKQSFPHQLWNLSKLIFKKYQLE